MIQRKSGGVHLDGTSVTTHFQEWVTLLTVQLIVRGGIGVVISLRVSLRTCEQLRHKDEDEDCIPEDLCEDKDTEQMQYRRRVY